MLRVHVYNTVKYVSYVLLLLLYYYYEELLGPNDDDDAHSVIIGGLITIIYHISLICLARAYTYIVLHTDVPSIPTTPARDYISAARAIKYSETSCFPHTRAPSSASFPPCLRKI